MINLEQWQYGQSTERWNKCEVFVLEKCVGKWVDPVPNKRSKRIVKLSWVRDSRRVKLETQRREEATSEIWTELPLTCAVDISTKKQLRPLLLLLLLPLRTETSKKLQQSKGVKTNHPLSFTLLHEVFFFVFLIIVHIQETTFCHENCIFYIYCWYYKYIKFCSSKIGSTRSYLFSVNTILAQQAYRWTDGELSEFYDPITVR